MEKGKYFPDDYFITKHEHFLRAQGMKEDDIRRSVDKLKQDLMIARAYKEMPVAAKES